MQPEMEGHPKNGYRASQESQTGNFTKADRSKGMPKAKYEVKGQSRV